MYVFARASASVNFGHLSVTVVEGQIWAADDPFVTANRHLFSTEPAKVHRTVAVVEDASAAPGVKRAARRAS